MPETSSELADLQRYADLIGRQLEQTGKCPSPAEEENTLQVERGIIYPQALVEPESMHTWAVERFIELAQSDRVTFLSVVDRGRHCRPIYKGLLIYCCLQACRIARQTSETPVLIGFERALRPWCGMFERELANIDWPATGMPATRGSVAAAAAWMALALFVGGRAFAQESWLSRAGDLFANLVRGASGRPTFLLASPGDNPETLWYHELVILHAAASYSVQAKDRALAAAVARNTGFHLNETQPDHATAQPWALFAFIWNPATHMLADQMLHTAAVQHPAGDDAMTLMLLADALYCLRLLL